MFSNSRRHIPYGESKATSKETRGSFSAGPVFVWERIDRDQSDWQICTVSCEVMGSLYHRHIDIPIITYLWFSMTCSREEKIIARAMTLLKDTHGSKQDKGNFTIPFEFVLPSSLPSSVKFPGGGRGFTGRIHYHLRAHLGDFTIDQPFEIVSAPLPSDIVPCLVEPTTHELKSFGVLKKGHLSVGASVENSRVGKGETLRVSVASRNDTSVDLTRVRVKLVELIEYKAYSEQATLKEDLEKLKDIDLPGLEKRKASKEEVRRNIRGEYEQNKRSIFRQIYEDLVSRHNHFDIVVPQDARDSYDGNLITISHYLKITFFTKASTDNPSTKIPIVIGSPSTQEQQEQPARQSDEPIATVIFDEDLGDDHSDTDTTVEVGSRAEFLPMAEAQILGPYGADQQEQYPPDDTIYPRSPARINPSAPTESMILEHEMLQMNDDSTVESDAAQFTSPPRRHHLGGPTSPQRPAGYSPYHMYNTPTGGRQRLPSYSYDTESGITTLSDTQQRLGGAHASPGRTVNVQWVFERLLQELDGSIHDYEVVSTKLRDPAYKEFFTMLTPNEFRSVIGHVSMSHQVQVALLLAKQMVRTSSFTCAHCIGALQKTSDYFRANMVETLLPYCSDLRSNFAIIKKELNEWEQVITSRAFKSALG